MSAGRLGAFHANYLSFSRQLIRQAIQQKWHIKNHCFELDTRGFGHVIYQISVNNNRYYAVFVTNYLADEARDDRVIAQSWDMSCCLWQGDLNAADIQMLKDNLPKQEFGRYSPKVLSISRANKSMRLFNYVLDCLSLGDQPDITEIKKIGYLVRTTAVYGNGKLGMADYAKLQDTDFDNHFQAQMFLVYLVRHFTLEWVMYLASIKRGKPCQLNSNIAMFLGTGNSTGLGMLPFLIKHPQVVNAWIKQREQALYAVVHSKQPVNSKQLLTDIEKAIVFFNETRPPDPKQVTENKTISHQLTQLKTQFKTLCENSNALLAIYHYALDNHFSNNTQEVILNLFLENYPEIAQRYANFNYIKPYAAITTNVSIQTLMTQIEKNYDWAIAIDFAKKENLSHFWYRSTDKEEPRRGDYQNSHGVDKQMKIAIAKTVYDLYQSLRKYKNENITINEFLLNHQTHSAAVQRVLSYDKQPYGEIRTNLLSEDFYPIDLLRVKLSCFGAVKFDPKSDKWLRVTFFQGAPLIDKNGFIAHKDNWFLYTPDTHNK